VDAVSSSGQTRCLITDAEFCFSGSCDRARQSYSGYCSRPHQSGLRRVQWQGCRYLGVVLLVFMRWYSLLPLDPAALFGCVRILGITTEALIDQILAIFRSATTTVIRFRILAVLKVFLSTTMTLTALVIVRFRPMSRTSQRRRPPMLSSLSS
jgi:hypothetical protein